MMERSFGAIIFRKEEDYLYLLLHYPSQNNNSYFEFAKGHPEQGEEIINTVKREVKEETAIDDLNFVPGFKERITYFYIRDGERVLKEVTFFLAETKKKDITISHEHIGYKFLPFKEAYETVKFKNSKEVLKKAHNKLTTTPSLF